jgi:hypothetical protein
MLQGATMALCRRFRSRMTLVYAGLALGPLVGGAAAPPAEPPPAPDLAIRYRTVVSPLRVRALTVLPGETVTFAVADGDPGRAYVARPAAGRLAPLGTGRWAWTAPPTPGIYPIQVVGPDGTDSVTLQAFVVVPYDRLEGDLLNGYRIGRYPEHSAHGGAGHGPPAGFVEVTRENENVLVSPHFRLKQFLCKQAGGYPKYVVLDERLLLALEHVLQVVNAAGVPATTFHVMSGYRTPAYNRALGNVRFSQHQWGAAADIFIDENGDGVMDDLNGDGRSDLRDADVLYRLIDVAATRPEAQGLIGGLGKYPKTAAHGPFVHVDVRDSRARW